MNGTDLRRVLRGNPYPVGIYDVSPVIYRWVPNVPKNSTSPVGVLAYAGTETSNGAIARRRSQKIMISDAMVVYLPYELGATEAKSLGFSRPYGTRGVLGIPNPQ